MTIAVYTTYSSGQQYSPVGGSFTELSLDSQRIFTDTLKAKEQLKRDFKVVKSQLKGYGEIIDEELTDTEYTIELEDADGLTTIYKGKVWEHTI